MTNHHKLSVDGASSIKSRRVVFIDVLRGYAILMMLQGHVIGVVLADEYRNKEHWLYGILHYLKGLTAPSFFLASGIIFSYLILRKEAGGIPYRRKGVTRGAWLIIIGFLLQWKPVFLEYLGGDQWYGTFYFLNSTHVLHTVGLSLILIVALRSWFKGRRFYIMASVLACIVLFFGCYVYVQSFGGGAARVLEIFLVKPYAVFPLMPWCGFVLIGAILGALGWEKSWFSSPKKMIALIVVGICLMVLGNGILFLDKQFFPYASKSFMSYWRAGEVIIFTALIALGCFYLEKAKKIEIFPIKVLQKTGSETFVIYVLHAILLYGNITDFGVRNVFSKNLGPWGTLAMVLTFIIFFVWLSFALPRWRQKFPWLRHIR